MEGLKMPMKKNLDESMSSLRGQSFKKQPIGMQKPQPLKSKKPIDIQDQENNSKLFNAPRIDDSMSKLPKYYIENKKDQDIKVPVQTK